MKTLHDHWLVYREVVLPTDFTEQQVEDVERAFFAGAVANFNLIMTAAGENDKEKVTNLSQELSDYSENIVRKAMVETAMNMIRRMEE